MEDTMTLYHGSPDGIEGDIKPLSESICDFGVGFYTSTDASYAASNFADVSGGHGFLYTIEADISDLKVYRFDDLRLWMLFTAYNRQYISDIEKYEKLYREINSIESYDVICGLIADDRSAYAFGRFLDGAMTDVCLENCIKHFDLGYQYVFKTDAAVSKLLIQREDYFEGERYENELHIKNKRIGTSVDIVREYERKYRRDGLFLDELIERYI